MPLCWSDGSLFGSLCLLDSQARTPDTPLEQRVGALRASIEGDLRTLAQQVGREETEAYAEAMFRYALGGILLFRRS